MTPFHDRNVQPRGGRDLLRPLSPPLPPPPAKAHPALAFPSGHASPSLDTGQYKPRGPVGVGAEGGSF